MATETGSVTETREPVIPVRVPESPVIGWVVDTGFSGALMLPREFLNRAGVPVIGKETFQLVSGKFIVASLALIEIDWLGRNRIVRVIISENTDALIGAELLDGNRLVVDYLTNQVTLTSR